MRKTLYAAAIAAFVATASLTAKPAQAMALPAAAGLGAAADALSVTEKVNCRAVWRCGPWGCGWRRVCWAPAYSPFIGAPFYGPRVVHWGGGWRGYHRPWGWGGPRFYRPHWGWGGPRVYRSHWGWRGGPRVYRSHWGWRGGPRVYRSHWGWRGGGPRFYRGRW